MFSGVQETIARERADLALNMEYMRDMVRDHEIQEACLIYEASNGGEDLYTEHDLLPYEEEVQIQDALNRMPDGMDVFEEGIDRLLAAEDPNVTIDVAMGISTPEDPTPTDIAYENMSCGSSCASCNEGGCKGCDEGSSECSSCNEGGCKSCEEGCGGCGEKDDDDEDEEDDD